VTPPSEHAHESRVNRRNRERPLTPAEEHAIAQVSARIARVQILQDRGVVDGPAMAQALADVQTAAAAASLMIEGRR
jgi:hypothetical protein